MAELSAILNDAWLLFLISIITTLVIFPIAFLSTFVYDSLQKSYPKTPKILLMIITTFVGTFITLLLLYWYLGGVFLPQAAPA